MNQIQDEDEHSSNSSNDEQFQSKTDSTQRKSFASALISPNRDIIFRTSFLNYPFKLGLIVLSSVIVSFIMYSFPETLYQFKIGTLLEREVGVAIPVLGLIPAFLFLQILFRVYDQKYFIGLESITKLTGCALFLTTNSVQSYLNEIRSIEVSRTLIQRFFKIGDVQISIIGSEHSETILEGVRNPETVKGIIEHRRHQLKSSGSAFYKKSLNKKNID